jgi:hypothetical protein
VSAMERYGEFLAETISVDHILTQLSKGSVILAESTIVS